MSSKTDTGKLGLTACIAMLAGGCIGSSIFSLSGMTMYYAGPAAILSWILAAAICGCYGLQAAELSIRYPKSGGVYTFPSRAISKDAGFLTAWGYLVSNVIAVAFAAIYVGTYLAVGWTVFSNQQIPLAILSVLFCTWMCLNKISTAGKINNILVSVLILTMLTYVIVAFSHPNFNPANFQNFFGQGVKGSTGWIEAVPNAMTGFGSIVAVAFLVGQVENPKKNVPLATLVALGLVVLLYVLMIAATMGHVTAQFLTDNPGMRFIPMFAAAFTSMGNIAWLPKLIAVSAVIALLTTMLVVLNLTANAMKAMADDDRFPAVCKKLNRSQSPSTAIWITTIAACLLSCLPKYTELLVNLGSLVAAVNIAMVILAAVFARKKATLEEGAFAAPGGNAVSILTVIIILCTYIPKFTSGDLQMWLFTAIIYGLGLIAMAYYRCRAK